MYTVINRTTNSIKTYDQWSMSFEEEYLNGNDLIIVSANSNTIKVPCINNNYVEWKEYRFNSLHIDPLPNIVNQRALNQLSGLLNK